MIGSFFQLSLSFSRNCLDDFDAPLKLHTEVFHEVGWQ